ncbi:hypothetical protein ACGF5M_03345 [Gemmatimonadota bacterium]
MKIFLGVSVWAITFVGVWSLCRAAACGDRQNDRLRHSMPWPDGDASRDL